MEKRTLIYLFNILIVSPVALAAVQPSEAFSGSVSLVNNDVYHLFWKSDDTSITFEVHAKVKGWVGFGLSSNGRMYKSDFVIGWVKDGVPYFKDRYGEVDEALPKVDVSQDWTLITVGETSTHTVLKFKRPLKTCDPEDRDVTTDTMRVMFAYSDTDPSSEDIIAYHGNKRGTKSIMLLAVQETVPDMPTDAFSVDLMNNNVEIPDNTATTYWCQGFLPPPFTQKNHLIKVEPKVQAGNEALVHHIVLYACYHTPSGLEAVEDRQGFRCFSGNMPWDACLAPFTAWGIGGEAYSYPDHVGLPFGDENAIRYIRMETHYDNPFKLKGLVDSSGLRLWFTSSLRQYDAGMFEAGMIVTPIGQILPGGYQSLTFHGHCTKDCLAEGMGSTPEIHIFSDILHTHLLGTGIRVHHYRDGVEKPYMDADMTYDFNYQEIRSLRPEITVKKGDNLVVECIYNTEKNTHATYGGLGTPDEMCMAFLYYYPKINLGECTSAPTQNNMAKQLSFKYRLQWGSPDYFIYGNMANITEGPHSGKTFNQYIDEIGKFPDQATMNKYQEAIQSGEFEQQCRQGSYYHQSHDKTAQVAVVLSAYQEIDTQCSGTLPNHPLQGRTLAMVFSNGLSLLLPLNFMFTTN